MAIGKFFRSVFGGDNTVEMSDDPFGSRRVQPPTASAVAAPPAEPRCIVQREEVIDGRSRIAGYRFIVRRFGSALTPTFAETVAALRAENCAAFAERRLALLTVSAEDCLRGEFRQFQSAQAICLIPSPAPGSDREAWRQALAAVKASGTRIAIDGDAADDAAALALADLCLLDFRSYSLENFERLLRRLTRAARTLPVAVDGVGSWAEHRLCMDRGASYSLGGFAASADAEEGQGRLNQSRLVLIEMLNQLRGEAELADIAALAKRDPGVAVKIVSMANAPVLGLSAPVASVDQAILVLGRDTLYRWLSIAMFRAGSGGGRDESLLEMALWRGRFLELVATGNRGKPECDQLFMVGLLSLLDSLLGLPMAQVVQRMTLPEAVAEVLLHSAGPFGKFLLLALAVEKGRVEQAERFAGDVGIDLARIQECTAVARNWVEEAIEAG